MVTDLKIDENASLLNTFFNIDFGAHFLMIFTGFRTGRLQELLNDSDKRVDSWIENAESALNFASSVQEDFGEKGIDGKKLILSCICSNLTLKDKKVSVQLTEFFSLVEAVTRQVPRTSAMFEPAKSGLNKRKIGQLYARNPLVQGRRESNPR